MPQTLLIVDDQEENRTLLRDVFKDEYTIHLARNGQEALDALPQTKPDLIILDIMMPVMDGYQTCLRLRQTNGFQATPIIFLTSKTEPDAETFGLELGADDFVIKPFNKEVLKARVKKRLGGGASQAAHTDVTRLDGYEIQWERQEVIHDGERIPLTSKEVRLLQLFVKNRGKVLSRQVILEKIWSETYITDRTIDSHVKELRKKIPPLTGLIKTIYGAGYRMD